MTEPTHEFHRRRIVVHVDGTLCTIRPDLSVHTPQQYSAVVHYFRERPCREWRRNPFPDAGRYTQIRTITLDYTDAAGAARSITVTPSGIVREVDRPL